MSERVLVLCNSNAIRSPMAAVLLNHLAGGPRAESAGITPGEADPLSAAALDEIGLSIPDGPRPVEAVKLGRFDLIVALSPQATPSPVRNAASTFGCPSTMAAARSKAPSR